MYGAKNLCKDGSLCACLCGSLRLFFGRPIGSIPRALSSRSESAEIHAPEPLLPADSSRDSEGGRGRVAPADAARRHDPPGSLGHLCLAASRTARRREDQPHRARGAESLRRDRASDADHPVRRPVARERTLRRLRQGDAAHQGPARPRHALRPDQRGDDHRHLPRLCPKLQGPAAQSLPYTMEVPGRDPAALRPHARSRVPDEGCLFLRSRPSGRASIPTTRCSSPICGPSPGSASRPSRWSPIPARSAAISATSSSSWPRPARARSIAIATISRWRRRRRARISTTGLASSRIVDRWTSLYAATSEKHDAAAFERLAAEARVSRRAASRWATSSTSARNTRRR